MIKNNEIFEETALEHLDAVYRAAVAICSRKSEAQDLVQETFLKAFEHFDHFEKGTNCKAWLLKILRNTWIDKLRHRKFAKPTFSFKEDIIAETSRDYETVWTDSENLIENFSDEQVIKALNELPEDQRLTLFLSDVEKLSQMEIAEITNVAVGTVKSRTSRARAELKRKLKTYAKEMGFIRGEK